LNKRAAVPTAQPFVQYFSARQPYEYLYHRPSAAAFLLAAGIDASLTNRDGKTAADLVMADRRYFSTGEERGEVLKLLAMAGTKLQALDSKGETLLHRAVRDPFAGARPGELIAAGADVNATNLMGRTPLHVLMERDGSIDDTLRELLSAKARVNAQDLEG
jgi:ankyrin repeat protein